MVTLYTKISSKLIKTELAKLDVKNYQTKTGKNLHNIGLYGEISDMISKPQETKAETDK